MCEQCQAKTTMYLGPSGEPVLPGYALVRATQDGWIMQKGDWGLVHSNDPDYWWKLTPVEDPDYGLTPEQIDAREDGPQDVLFDAAVVNLREALDEGKCPRFDVAVRLYEAATKAGYSAKEHGSFAYWLCHHLAVFLKTAKEYPDTDE